MGKGPVKPASVLLTMIVLGSVFLDYWQYSADFHKTPYIYLSAVIGRAYAPWQYRIGVVIPGFLLARLTHLGLRHIFTGFDLFSELVAVFSLFFLLRRSEVYRRATLAGRWFGAALLIVLVEFYLVWVEWYQRPETLPTTAILAVTLLLLTVRLPFARTAVAQPLTAAGLFVLAVILAFIRADVALALHAGVLLVCLARPWKGCSLSRPLQIATSLAAILTVAGIQYYLMHIRYPRSTYGPVRVVQLFENLHPHTGWIAFAVFVTPFLWTLGTVARSRWKAEAPLLGAFAGATLFLGMWLVFGAIEEVRIFLPFAMMTIPLTVTLAMEKVI